MKPETIQRSNSQQINVLLLEGIEEKAIETFRQKGYHIESYSSSISNEELKSKIENVHILGIRSKTQITRETLNSASNLWAIGCFCIGTNQVDLTAATEKGIIVFNSPYCNSRSVAEMVLGEMIMLVRQIFPRTMEMHQGIWRKTSMNCHEIRGKTVGIVGYGHVGSQLSILAEAIGMNVIFHDIIPIMPIGLAKSVGSLQELLSQSDFVTLHVPETPATIGMISTKQISQMKRGSFLLNASRGSVVDLKAVADALESGHLLGAAIDVYLDEPTKNNTRDFVCALQNHPNCILTPHIGGSTSEAQRGIAIEVASKICKFLESGCTLTCLNMPEMDLHKQQHHSNPSSSFARLVVIHQNVPGVLKAVNQLLQIYNVERQICDSKGFFAVLLVDLQTFEPANDDGKLCEIVEEINRIPQVIRTLVLNAENE